MLYTKTGMRPATLEHDFLGGSYDYPETQNLMQQEAKSGIEFNARGLKEQMLVIGPFFA